MIQFIVTLERLKILAFLNNSINMKNKFHSISICSWKFNETMIITTILSFPWRTIYLFINEIVTIETIVVINKQLFEMTRFRTDGEEVVENEDEYEYNNQNEKRKSPENVNRNDDNERLNQSDEEKTIDKKEDDGSDLSIDEDETEDEDEKKREDTNK